LDCAIRGDGFFVVSKDGKDYFTRKGDFHKDSDGRLLTADGAEVQGEGGTIQIPQNTVLNSILVTDDGTVRADARIIGKLKIAEFEDPSKLLRAGDTLFAAPEGVEPIGDVTNSQVSNRTLEHSNTSVSEEMADLIKTMRNYQACQKMIRNYDENTGRMIQHFST
jgi:flagellar basal-body rod protein FlgG